MLANAVGCARTSRPQRVRVEDVADGTETPDTNLKHLVNRCF